MKRESSSSDQVLKRAEDRGQKMRQEKKYQIIKEKRKIHSICEEKVNAADLPVYCK